MKDRYFDFATSGFGTKVTSFLGLPQPPILERETHSNNVIDGGVLLGGTTNSELIEVVQKLMRRIKADVHQHKDLLDNKNKSSAWRAETQVKALIFDASGLASSKETIALYHFFQDSARSLQANGRVIILGRRPRKCPDSKKSIAQRSLEGFSRSLAKELGRGITAQLVYADDGVTSELESTFRFLLSPRSAYVSGQVINVRRAPSSSREKIRWSSPLKGKSVLVTGAARGIGASIAMVMAGEGAKVTCLDLPAEEDDLRRVAKSINAKVLPLNLRSDSASSKLVSAGEGEGGWDIVVHNAGITRDKTIAKMPLGDWEAVVDINLSTQETINDALIQSDAINKGGRVICVSSISGIAGNRGQSNYALSKAGVIGMVDSLAPVLAKKGITINAVAPGFIETEMTAKIPFGIRQAGRRLNSLGQGGLPVDVAEAIAWLASPGSNGLTANTIRVCGQSIVGA